jgi:hypothetical protein
LFDDLISKVATNFAKKIWFNDSFHDLQWMSLEFGDNLFNFFGNKTNTLLFSSQIFINWNGLIE